MTEIFTFDSATGELTGSFTAKVDPRTGREILPPTSHKGRTLVEPPAAREGFACVFDRSTQTWSHVEDHRGVRAYWKSGGGRAKITKLGSMPRDVIAKARPSEWHVCDTGADYWVEDTGAKDMDAKREAARQRVIANNRDIAIVLGLVDPA